MTRAAILPLNPKRNAPSYYEHKQQPPIGSLLPPVHYGGALVVNSDDPESLRDPFNMARKFARAFRNSTGEHFAWGWYETPDGATPGVCALELAGKYLRIAGDTRL